MSEPEEAARRRRLAKRAAAIGAVLGLICGALPPTYQTPCHLIVQICTAGHLP